MFTPAAHLNGQYTVVGQLVDGYEVLDAISLALAEMGDRGRSRPYGTLTIRTLSDCD